tara:strand:- start:233 stop:823 length:591 start_codon:yes stop_codon:yes gene_type:complete
MPIVLNGSGTVTGISVGGLPDGIIQAADLATGVGGKILQVQQGGSNVASSASVASQATYDTGIQVSITPSSASSKILLIATISGCVSSAINNFAMILQKKTGSGSFANITAANGAAAGNRFLSMSGTYGNSIYTNYGVHFNYLDTGGSTDTLIYRGVYFNSSSSTRTVYINRSHTDTDSYSYTRGSSWIQVMEVAA